MGISLRALATIAGAVALSRHVSALPSGLPSDIPTDVPNNLIEELLSEAPLPESPNPRLVFERGEGDAEHPSPPKALPKCAPDGDKRWQPVMDFDTDSCYNVPAIGPDGELSKGHKLVTTNSPQAFCRDPWDLENSNAYSRSRCNNGWCVYMYGYYFEKDQSTPLCCGGHTHDWEHVLVWVKDGASSFSYASTSAHGKYTTLPWNRVRAQGDRVKIVYHKDGASTHAMRFANERDDAIENHSGQWFLADLVSYDGFPNSQLRDKMLANDWGSATPDIRDSRFGGEIQNAINAARKDSKGKWTFDIGGYNANDDAGSPGTPNCNGVPTNPNPDPGNPGGEQPAPGKRKFMIAGDSISHGAEDDWTWRYRLWQWLRSSGYDVEFVGPFRGTHITPSPSESIPKPPRFEWEPEPQESKSTAGRYADGVDGDFKLSGHAAWWGRQAVQSKDTIKGWVKDHQPDYLLLLLGFNDLGWWVSGPDDLVGNMGQLVQAAREAKPDIRILVGNVVHRSFIGGRQDLVDNTDRYNAELKTRLKGWFRYESPIVYVDVNANYDCHPHDGCADGYDGLHPNARGEYHIAQAFARALRSQFGFSKGGEFSVPIIPGRPVGTPTNVRSYAWPEGDGTTWDRMYNARGYDIRSRIQGAEGWWSDGAVYPNTWTSWAPWVTDGQVWEYQVRTQGDGDTRSAWSGSSVVTSRPKTAPGPDNIVVMPYGNDAIQFSWTPVTGYSVNRYSVIVWNQDIAGSFVQNYAASGASTIIPGLVPGHLYSVWIATCNNLNSGLNGQAMVACGLPQAANDVRVGGTAPSPPSNLRVTNIDPTTVKLEWSAGANAVGYFIYVELVSGDKPRNRDGSTTSTTHSIGFLFPGTWNYRFCVSSYNGSLETAASCVVPPKYPGFKKRGVEVPEEVEVPKGFTLADNVEEAYNATTMVEDPTLKMLNRLWTQQKEAAFF